MRVVFMGTPDIAATCLNKIIEKGHQVVAVYTQPDRPKNRGMKLAFSPVKEVALANEIPVYHPENFRQEETVEKLRSLQPDVVAVVAYGRILPQNVLDIPAFGCINIHASLLPSYRGSAPYQWAVLDGLKETGVTAMYLCREMDAGDMIDTAKTQIGENETAGEVFDRLALLGAKLIVKTVELIEKGQAPRIPQDESKATHCKMIEKADALIDFEKEPYYLCAHVRGMNPWPIAFAMLDGTAMKVYEAKPCEGAGAPGQILCADTHKGLIVACKNGAVSFERIQMPGGKPVSAKDYLRGHRIEAAYLGGKNG